MLTDQGQSAQIQVLFTFEHDMDVANADRQQINTGFLDEAGSQFRIGQFASIFSSRLFQ